MKDPIIFFDGYCLVCISIIHVLLKIDKKRTFRYGLINSKTFTTLVIKNKTEEQPDSVIYLSQGKIYIKSAAVFRMINDLGGIWRVFNFLKIFPVKLLNYLYDFIAKNRNLVFGKKDTCYLPANSEKHLFLP